MLRRIGPENESKLSNRVRVYCEAGAGRLTRTTLVHLAEHDLLELVVARDGTSGSDTTENVSAGTLEERAHALLGDDRAGSVEHALVVHGTTRGHHHATTDRVERVRSETSRSSNNPAEQERGKEVLREVTGQDNGLERVVETEVETTVDNDTNDRGDEATVETGNTVRGEGLTVDVDETVELTVTARLSVLGVVGKTGTGVVERVDEEEGGGTSSLRTVLALGYLLNPPGR